MLWTHAQCPANHVHVVADVHTLDINSSRGGWEQSSQNRSDKHHSRIIIDYISSLTSFMQMSPQTLGSTYSSII